MTAWREPARRTGMVLQGVLALTAVGVLLV
jgi:hypothetical protein